MLVLLMEGVYELSSWDGLKCHDRVYIPSFIRIGSGIQNLLEGIYMQTHKHRQEGDLMSLLLLFQNKESRLKTK
jgi:hypothetical protein